MRRTKRSLKLNVDAVLAEAVSRAKKEVASLRAKLSRAKTTIIEVRTELANDRVRWDNWNDHIRQRDAEIAKQKGFVRRLASLLETRQHLLGSEMCACATCVRDRETIAEVVEVLPAVPEPLPLSASEIEHGRRILRSIGVIEQ